MCGIVGYLGSKNVSEVLVQGLRSLEYRGYDSAGIAVSNGTSIERVRASGKLQALEQKLKSYDIPGNVGIAHTRWATHGKPTENNAHPHKSDTVYIVHNGIIENYLEIKEELLKAGTLLTSETDSELVSHLLTHEIQSGKSLFNSVLSVKKKLRGAYSILAISEKEPDVMIGFKLGPPLLVGKGDREVIFSSDALAIIPHTQDVMYLNDGEITLVKNGEISLYNDKGETLPQSWTTLNWTASQTDKAGYEHFMLKEIYEQPIALKNAISPHINNYKVYLDKATGLTHEELKNIERIFIVACGTSYYAGMYGKYVIEKFSGVPVEIDVASEFRYRDPSLSKNSLVLVISQSGETADTLAALRLSKEKKAKVLSLCNTKLSTIDREADFNFYMNSGIEIGVASTKAFTSSLGILAVLSLALAKVHQKLSPEVEEEKVRSLLSASAKMEAVLNCDNFFSEAAKSFKDFKGFLYMGRGVHYPLALEGALKMKELAYKHAEGYAAGEMKHGPLALIDENMLILMLCPKDRLYEKTLSNLEEAKARGGYIVSIGTLEDEKLAALSEEYLALPEADEFIYPLLEAIPIQLLSYHVSKALGHNVDQPRNLAKSVTVE